MFEKILNIQHHLNPLHVYCRMIDTGMNTRVSLSICKWYEIVIYSWLVLLTRFAAQACKLVKAGKLTLFS